MRTKLSAKIPKLSIAFAYSPGYNEIVKPTHYNISFGFCQERIKNMDDLDPLPLKDLILQALEKCIDPELLDLVYKLLISDAPTK